MSTPVARGEGLRIQLRRIPGVTKGEAAKILEKPYRFQCPPMDTFEIQRQRSFGTYTNYKGAEFLSRGGKQLQPITFRTIAVEYANFVVERWWEEHELVDYYVDRLTKIWDAGWPVELLATHAYNQKAELHMDAVIESVTVVEVAGEKDARYIDIGFKQWRDPVVTARRRGGSTAVHWPQYLTLDKDRKHWRTTHRMKIPVKKPPMLADQWTFALLAKYAYGKPSLAKHIMAAQKPAIHGGAHTPIMDFRQFRKGGRVKIPAPPPVVRLPTGDSNELIGLNRPPGI